MKLNDFLNGQKKLFIFADFDGTLSEIVPDPPKARPLTGAVAILKKLKANRNIKVAVVSGREISFLRKFFPADFTLVGCHGAEILQGGRRSVTKLSPPQKNLIDMFSAFFKACPAQGIFNEEKKLSIAVHYRKAPLKTAAMIVKAAKAAAPFLEKFDMEILMGKKVIEIRPRGISKGEAVRKLAASAKAYRPVYFGDDATDEDAFRLSGVTGVKIGPGKSAARFRLAGPREALEALGRIRL